ncbi:hypothetical protein ABEF86_16095 (plasmid) [Acinetobacter thermotolerans]|uniref:hypothetical protein n=1 Tax=Acinetobacter thermotolerans TaxID=3151487 RepID=UPI00325AB698
MTKFANATHVNQDLSLDVGKERTTTALVTTATAYKKGDLLALSDANVLTHATDEKTWDVICTRDISAAEATAMAAASVEVPVYYAGKFNVAAVSISGTKLATNKYAAARAKATKNRIELAKV